MTVENSNQGLNVTRVAGAADRSDETLLSLIVPAVTQTFLPELFRSFDGFLDPRVEIVLINQSGETLPSEIRDCTPLRLIEHMTDRIPAAAARNLGATLATGKYLLFLDDDAVLETRAATFPLLFESLKAQPDAVILQRGEQRDGRYHSHWPRNFRTVTFRNFPRLVIEWNLVIGKQVFAELEGFPAIGAGSAHSAQSGEAFVLTARLLAAKKSISLLPDARIAHPSLFGTQKSLSAVLGYAYGSGYAVGLGIASFDCLAKVYWLTRSSIAAAMDLGLRRVQEQAAPPDSIDSFDFRATLSQCRIAGLLDAVQHKSPRSLVWLESRREWLIQRKRHIRRLT